MKVSGKQAEELLRELSSAVDQTADSVMICGRDGLIRYVNHAFELHTGYPKEEAIGKTPRILKSGKHEQFFYEDLWRTILSGRVFRAVFTNRKKNGVLYFEERTISPLKDSQGNISAFVSVGRDISERRREEEKFRALVEGAPDAIVGVNRDGRIVLVNAQTERSFGYSREELLGQPVENLLCESLREVHKGHRAAFNSDPHARPMGSGLDLCARRKDGTEFPVAISLGPIETEAGPLVVATITDITERKRTDEALRFAQFAMDRAPMATYWMGPDGRFFYVNDAACSMLGFTREELLSMSVSDIDPDYPAESWPEFWREVKQRDSFTFESHHRTKDGRIFPVEITATYLEFDGKEYNCSRVRDVTERAQLEQQFRQAQKMEAVGRLAGGVAHDFNNLLMVMRGYTELLLGRLGANDPLRSNVEEIQKAADRATSLTRQLLAFSRKQVMQPRVFDLNAVVADTEKMLRRLIGEDIELATILGPELGRVKSDPDQINQVILNLAVNARDAMPQGGKLVIETANVELTQAFARQHPGVTPGPHVLLAMSDTGVGMDAETQARIFEPFFTTKEQGKGTGLGLATVYGIVKQSGGYIWVYSEAGQGTTFEIYLPRVEETVEADRKDEALAEAPAGSETVLLVEDEKIVRKLSRDFLEGSGYQVLDAKDGAEALQIAERHGGPIHLLLTDVVMPGMSGRELAERLASRRPETKVLYVSGYTDDAIVQHGIVDRGTSFLQKPFSLDALARKVRAVLEAGRAQ